MSIAYSSLPSNIPPSFSSSGGRRATLPPSGLELLNLPLLKAQDVQAGSGLRTPPVDDMSTAYQPTMPYHVQSVRDYAASMAHAARAKAAMVEPQQNTVRYDQQQPAASHQRYPGTAVASQQSMQAMQPARPISPKHEPAPSRKDKVTGSGSSDSLIYHSLHIPRCISANGGNLADFAAQMTCLFWFESMDDLKQAETIRQRPHNAAIPRLPPLAKPTEQFRKWVYSVLSTTQVTQNVILLALLFIFRLRRSTPAIKGRGGSEFRLLTVALMLGNKFLDDNTYTNKTWAEVSAFAVTEVHVMEVEFLSNMRYNLLASAAEWEQWLVKLSCFHEYYERALLLPPSPIAVPAQMNKAVISPVPSPTASSHLEGSDIFNTNYSPSSSQSQNWAAFQPHTISPLAGRPSLGLPATRKRAPDDEPVEHPAKRQAPARLTQLPPDRGVIGRTNPMSDSQLPMPQLTVATNTLPHHQPTPASYSTPSGTFPQQAQAPLPSQPNVSLPPLHTGVRAMATVYQPTPPVTMIQQPTPTPIPTSAPSLPPSVPTVGFPTSASLPAQQQLGTPSKRRSPGSLAPFASSPLGEPFGPGSAVHTPLAHTPLSSSPSVYLQQRNSPYKPIRHVNTLLYPPPSASLEQYHLSVPLQPTQMHYQPLGRRNDLRTGVVPEYILYNRAQANFQQQQQQQQQHQHQQQQQPQQMQQGPRQHGMQHGLHYPS